jgi:formylglycine-generating enzyme required for sulfatase activity
VKAALTLAFGLALGCAVSPTAAAQTPAGLHIQVYAGLTITGAVGTVYSVDYVTDLTQSNNAAAWRCLEYLQLPASPYLWVDKSAPATRKRFYRAVVMEAPTNMVFIAPGTFRMGSPTNEGPQTDVIITRGFWMGKYEVTQEEYLAVTGYNPSYFRPPYYTNETNLPVDTVGWFEATNYCAMLTQKERAAGRIATNSAYRLPTEAEWEYACRAWTSTRFFHGDDPDLAERGEYAWSGLYFPRGRTHPVGQKLPNPWGLYDMYGNVWEWCQDWWGLYPGGVVLDPQGPASGSCRVYRGGDFGGFSMFGTPGSACRGTYWDGLPPPDIDIAAVGFRAVLAPGKW